ncbi:TPA: segregation/condensation protein A, partial [Candidatus Poribacteria bacterium]|nr:segregation/condensation protein A [Candidatus Poribacteria bacterium]
MQTAESLDQQISYYTIRLDVFEGPLDLLLHLIQKDEMDICDVSIADITDQYVNYINLMEELDLDVASEFLVMGATL